MLIYYSVYKLQSWYCKNIVYCIYVFALGNHSSWYELQNAEELYVLGLVFPCFCSGVLQVQTIKVFALPKLVYVCI